MKNGPVLLFQYHAPLKRMSRITVKTKDSVMNECEAQRPMICGKFGGVSTS